MVVARTENVAAAKLLLDHGAHVNAQRDSRGTDRADVGGGRKPAGHGAGAARAWRGCKRAVASRRMAGAGERGAARAASSYGGFTPLLFATREGCLSCVQSLVEGGAKLNLPDPEGVTPLIMAIFNAHFDTAKYLIEKGAKVDKWDWWGRSPLYCAVDFNTIPHGGRADGPSLDETTPLDIIAAASGQGRESESAVEALAAVSRRWARIAVWTRC